MKKIGLRRVDRYKPFLFLREKGRKSLSFNAALLNFCIACGNIRALKSGKENYNDKKNYLSRNLIYNDF